MARQHGITQALGALALTSSGAAYGASDPGLAIGAVQPLAAGEGERRFAIDLAAGQGVAIDLAAVPSRPGASDDDAESAPDMALWLLDPAGRCVQAVPARDGCASSSRGAITALQEAAESGTVRLAFRPEQRGRYTLAATAPASDGVGRYELLARQRVIAPPPVASAISLCEDALSRAAAASGDSESAPSYPCDKPYALAGEEKYFAFTTTRPDQWVGVEMKSEPIDGKVELRGPLAPGQAAEEAPLIAEDDDSGDNLNARLRRKLPSPGRYVVKAMAVGEKSGPFTLAVRALPAPPPPPPPAALADGDTSGAFAGDEPTAHGTMPYRLYTLSGRAGETVTIDMTSEDIDSYLEALVPEGRVVDAGADGPGYAAIAWDDDGGEGRNARLTLRFNQAAPIAIRAAVFNSAGATGAYKLSVKRTAAAAP